MELNNCINFLLSTAQHNVFQYLSSRLSEYGVTPAQYGVMSCLWRYRDLTPKQIGELLHLEASSVSGILERMQNNGLLERNVDPENRRNIRVSPTQKTLDHGRRLLELLKQPLYHPMPVSRQAIILYVATSGLVDDVPLDRVRQFVLDFADEMEAEHADVVEEIQSTGNLSGVAVETIRAALADYKKEKLPGN